MFHIFRDITMPKLNSIHGYYDPIKFMKKTRTNENLINEKELIEYLNKAYRHAIRKILLEPPASFAEISPIYDLCIEAIFSKDDITTVTVVWIEDQINKNKEFETLKNLNPNDPHAVKLQLIKTVTNVHQDNLATINEPVISFINSALALENILNKEYKYGVLYFSEKSDSVIKEAVAALRDALKEKPVNLLSHISTLRKGKLGDAIRVFVKQGLADILLDGKKVLTVSDFITTLHQQVNTNSSLIAPNP